MLMKELRGIELRVSHVAAFASVSLSGRGCCLASFAGVRSETAVYMGGRSCGGPPHSTVKKTKALQDLVQPLGEDIFDHAWRQDPLLGRIARVAMGSGPATSGCKQEAEK